MERAKWKFVSQWYVWVDSLKNVWFPCAKFNKDSNKKLLVEIYEVDKDNIRPIDWLEWYVEWRADNHYNRVEIPCELIGEQVNEVNVQIYDYNRPLERDDLKDYLLESKWDKHFYEWKQSPL